MSSDSLIVRPCFLVFKFRFLYRAIVSASFKLQNKCRKNGRKLAGRPFQDGFCGGYKIAICEIFFLCYTVATNIQHTRTRQRKCICLEFVYVLMRRFKVGIYCSLRLFNFYIIYIHLYRYHTDMGGPVLSKLFVRYNTPVPSSAAVERFFSQGKAILRDKRANF